MGEIRTFFFLKEPRPPDSVCNSIQGTLSISARFVKLCHTRYDEDGTDPKSTVQAVE